jgi:hypothetical protein
MIGQEIGGGRGKRTGRRVIGTEPLRVEASFEDTGKLLGLDGMNIGTYLATPKPDGSLYGQGEGAFASLNGEMATWHGMGTGAFGPDGSVRYRGTLSFSSSGATLAKLNSAVVLFDFTIDAQGNTQSTFWDWKA